MYYTNLQTKENLDMDMVANLADNTALKNKPDIFRIWNFQKNNALGIEITSVTKATKKNAWWLCEDCNGTYPQRIDSKIRGSKCAICMGKYVSIESCLFTTHPKVSNLLLDKENGYKYSHGSDKRLDWKCSSCGGIVKDKQVKNIVRYGLSCPLCSDGTSYPEKLISSLLQQLGVRYENDISLFFSKDRRYDFYISELNTIIETHGEQHYIEGFKSCGGRTLKEEQENDIFKERLARENGIENYIVIDCRHSSMEWIRDSIYKTEMFHLLDLDLVDWDLADIIASSSKKKECLDIYLSGLKNCSEIADKLDVHYTTALRWLKEWNSVGKCDFTPTDTKKEIVQLDLNFNLIKIWSSVADARKYYKNVSKVLKNERENDQGFRFIYKNDYELFLKDPSRFNLHINKVKKQVVQLDKNSNLIRIWDSMIEASESVGLANQSSIGAVCQGKKKTAKGFRWMYLQDYENIYGRIE